MKTTILLTILCMLNLTTEVQSKKWGRKYSLWKKCDKDKDGFLTQEQYIECGSTVDAEVRQKISENYVNKTT